MTDATQSPAIDCSLTTSQVLMETRYKPDVTDHMIFVFGSNESGVHGAGAARWAMQHRGAKWGKGYGPMGQSYGIPSKDKHIQTLPFASVRTHVELFLVYAEINPELQFQVTCIGCGLAGFNNKDIAPLFKDAPANCHFDLAWAPYLPQDKTFWGTFTV